MTRVALTLLLPLIAPTLLYMLWLAVSGRAAELRDLPWPWLIGVGVVAAAAMLFIVGVHTGSDGDPGNYVPPHVEDGHVIPGGVVPGRVAP